MSQQARRFVKVEYVGGPWDGTVDVRDWPLTDDVVRVPLPQMWACVTEPPYDATGFRVGEYRVERSPRLEELFDIVAIGDVLITYSRIPVREMALCSVARKRPVIFKWEGEP